MIIKDFNERLIMKRVDEFAGLEHIGNGKNQDIEDYYQAFMSWLDKHNVLDILNDYNDTQFDLKNVNSYDFLIWLLHFGDVYDNLLRHRIRKHPNFDYKNDAIILFNLRQLHPKFSFAVALNAQLAGNEILSDNDLPVICQSLIEIPSNKRVTQTTFQVSEWADGLIDTLNKLVDFSAERRSKNYNH